MLAEQPPSDIAPYEVVRKLGEGGQCAVWEVKDPSGERFALKVMFDKTKNARERFCAEARLLQGISNPHIIRVHHLHEQSDPPWYLMDLLEGRDLDDEMAQGPVDPKQAARWIADVASGLQSVHVLGVRHRDIKPANVMIARDGTAKLIDFGIAREVGQAHLTAAGMVIGTMAYLPPEIFSSDDPNVVQDSVAADVYALGQTLYEILVGAPTHPRDGSQTKLMAVIMRQKMDLTALDPKEKVSTIPDELALIVRDATRREPRDRIPTAGDLEKRLRSWLSGRPATNPNETTWVRRGAPEGTNNTDVPTAPPPAPVVAPPPPPRRSAPDTVVRSLRHEPAPPPPSRGWGVWLASGFGTATLVGGIATFTVAILALVWLFRPYPGWADPEEFRSALRPALVGGKAVLAECSALVRESDRNGAQVTLRFEVRDQRATDIWVETLTMTDMGPADCLVRSLERMPLDGVPNGSARVPFALK